MAELCDAGELIEVAVNGWREPAYTTPDARLVAARPGSAALLAPFDSLIWERGRTRRLFGFDYRIEVYTPEPQRKYGYFVLPFLLDDRVVGRFDLKADRKTSTLRVSGAYVEPGADVDTVSAAAATELGALGDWLGLHDIAVSRRGNLARALERVIS